MLAEIGKLLILLGVAAMLIGILLVMIDKVPFLGRLPGDIGIQIRGLSCILPLATSIVLSIVLTLLLNLLLRVLNK